MATASASPPTKRRGPRNWTDDEWQSILAAIRELPPRKKVSTPGKGKARPVDRVKFWLALVLLARDTGLSRNRILKLRKSQLAPNGTIVVHFSDPDRDVVLRLKHDTMEAVKAADAFSSDLISPPFKQGEGFTYAWRKILRRAGQNYRGHFELWHAETKMKTSDRHCETLTETPEGERPASLLEFYVKHYQPLRLRGRSPRTDQLYRYSIANFGRYLGHPATLDDLTDLNVGGLLEWMRSRNLAVESLDKERSQLLALWRFACQLHFVQDFPNVQRDIIPVKVPKGWLLPELKSLFVAADVAKGTFGKVPARVFWLALLRVIMDSGERIGAVRALTWDCFDLHGGYLHIPSHLRKGKRADKFFGLKPATVEALKLLKSHAPPTPFHWPYCENYLYDKFNVLLVSAGLPTDSKSKFHRLRRTVASMFEAAGQNATKLLGHSSRSTTEKYIDPRLCKPIHAADVLPDPMDGGKVGAQ